MVFPLFPLSPVGLSRGSIGQKSLIDGLPGDWFENALRAFARQ
jgi:hypothetical protein